MEDLRGKIIVVTGTSSGIGRAAATELARRGAKVVCAARRPERGKELETEIRAAGGVADFVATDLASDTSLEALFRVITEKYGRLDGAFNNAGAEAEPAPLPDVRMTEFDYVMSVNARGTFLCMQHEMRIMRSHGGGSIVNTSSVGGITGLKGGSAYSASKHAIIGMSKSAALDGGAYGVRVNVICPGSCETEMMDRWTHGDPAIIERFASYAPLKRVGKPIEIANSALFLLSDLSSYMTGVVMEIDGGATAGVPM